MVRCIVNGNFLLTSNLAAEKHVHFSIGQAGIQYSGPGPAPLPPIRKSCTHALQESPFGNIVMPETSMFLFPMLSEPLKDGSGLFIVPFPTITH